MKKGVNRVILVGNLVKDPESRFMPNGDAVCNIVIATSETWKDKNTGQPQELTEFHRVVFFKRSAEIIAEYMRKGSKIYVEGRLRTRKWQDQSGQDKYTTEILGSEFQFLGGNDSRQSGSAQDQNQGHQNQAKPQQQAAPQVTKVENKGDGFDNFDDNIPF